MRRWNKVANTARAWWDRLCRRRKLSAWPLRIHLETNDYCNLACPVCPRYNADIPKNTGNMSLDVFEALRPAFRRAIHVGLAGNGEPFLHPHLDAALSIIVSENAVPSIVTNATLLDRDWARRLIDLGPMILMPSIDGGTKSVYEILRYPAIFEETRENLLTLREEKERVGSPYPVVNFIVTLCRSNAEDLPAIIRLAQETGAVQVNVQNCFPYNDEAVRQQIKPYSEIDKLTAEARDLAWSLGIGFEYRPMAFGLAQRIGPVAGFEFEEDRVWQTRHKQRRPAPLFCPNIATQLHVEINGDVRVCCFFKQATIGNVLQTPVPEIWNHPLMMETRQAMAEGRMPPDCSDCYLLDLWDHVDPVTQSRREFIQTLKDQ